MTTPHSLDFDYVIVGGGSAGCVITQRLVEAGKSVLLLEMVCFLCSQQSVYSAYRLAFQK